MDMLSLNNLDPREQALIMELFPAPYQILLIERRSITLYDILITGRYPPEKMSGCAFGAWLPLAAIAVLPPSLYAKAVLLSDYPMMMGDWSGIRDSSHPTIWRIFHQLCVPESTSCGNDM